MAYICGFRARMWSRPVAVILSQRPSTLCIATRRTCLRDSFVLGLPGLRFRSLFPIPLDAQPTEKRGPGDQFVWLLEALADVPGVNYHDVFGVPVFRTQQTPTWEEAATFAPVAPEQPATRPSVATVEVRPTAAGTEFYFPAARNKNFTAMTTVFLLIFGSATFFFIYAPALILFPLVFGFFSLLLLFGSAHMWLGTTRVVIGNGGVTLQAEC